MVSRSTMLVNDKEVAIRSYEVSIWTLQDSFITVLKWANLDNKGQIQQPKLTLDTDGTQNFNFSIPMYLNPEEENPAWYNTLNGNLMIGMRKIKVILNKSLEEEAVFEFLITKVTERHEANQLFCDVECEGLAFHELGKIGYKVALSADLYQLDYEEWYNSDQTEPAPQQTIQYWNDKTGYLLPYPQNESDIIPNKWYYKIEMNWETYSSRLLRDPNKVYEQEYVSSWETINKVLKPHGIEPAKEKWRPVEISESNIYNITQKIAEAFGVFCRYQYGYDANYHIISRTVIYYNNFIEEKSGHMDLTYPYHTSDITREMDSTELSTKLFVRPVDYEYSDSGELTIMSVDANKSREDYILNFDYLHKFNIISDEQYDAIAKYEEAMHDKNLVIEALEPKMQILNSKITEYEAKIAVEATGIEEGYKQYNDAQDKVSAVPESLDGSVVITQGAPKSLIVLTDESDNSLYVKMPFVGIAPDTVRLYDGIIDYTKQENQLENDSTALVNGGIFEYDNTTYDLIKITHLPKTVRKKVQQSEEEEQEQEEYEDVAISKSLWMTCTYFPTTYWEKVADYWQERINDISRQKEIDEALLAGFKTDLAELEADYDEEIVKKRTLIREFEEMMGPALREGYWQPENYQDYGNKYLAMNLQTETSQGKATYHPADEQCYDGNNKISYYIGDLQETYLVIDVNDMNRSYIADNYDKLCFIYYDVQSVNQSLTQGISPIQKAIYERNALRAIRIGGDCRFTYVKRSDTGDVILGLVIEASKYMSQDQLDFFTRENLTIEEKPDYSSEDYNPFQSKIGVITINNTTGEITVDETASIILPKQYLINNAEKEVYPRIIIDSLLLKPGEDELKIKLHDNILKPYKDYSIYVQTDLNDPVAEQRQKYMIDIKPIAFIKTGVSEPSLSLSYELSNADTLIYLDALEVAKENSQPKVSYNIKLSIYDPSIIHNIYQKLSKIVHINDNQLKFENVQGYIAKIDMSLDTPQEDEIEVKNYKTKFEDLFSNIVAQTDAMQKNSASYDTAAAAFNTDGALTAEAVEKMLSSNMTIFNTYVDNYLTESPVMQSMLTDVFNDAGEILGGAGSALSEMRNLTTRNSSILQGFARDSAHGFSKIQVNENGIFIGSDQKISLFSGQVNNLDAGVSVDLSPDRLILGAIDGSDGTTAKFTKDYLVIAAGSIIADSELADDGVVSKQDKNLNTFGITGLTTGLVGAKFTKDSIGFATINEQNILDDGGVVIGTKEVLNAILMNNQGITLGSSTLVNHAGGIDLTESNNALKNAQSGSIVRISGDGLILGSSANLYINTANFKIMTEATGNQPMFQLNKTIIDPDTQEVTYQEVLTYSELGGLEIKGNLSAESLVVESQQQQAVSLSRWVNSKVTPTTVWACVRDATNSSASGYQNTSFQITNSAISFASGGALSVNSGTFSVSTTNIALDTTAIGTTPIFKVGSSNPSPFRIKSDGSVYINKLMVLDVKDNSVWGLGGTDSDHDDVYVDTNDGKTYGYKAIDFSNLNFKQAVSASGSWNGLTYSTDVTLWGILNKNISNTASVSTASGVITAVNNNTGSNCSATITLSLTGRTTTTATDTCIVNASLVYETGWNAAANSVSYTSQSTSVTVPAVNGGTTSVDVTATYNKGWNDAALTQYVVGTCYTITDRDGDWVKVEEIGTGYSEINFV